MNIRELEYLIAIADELHFHRAAEKCFVSQPTLSGQIKKLEEELGVLLVERSNRQVTMTDAGKAIVEQARQVIGGTKIIKEMAQSFADPMQCEIQLGLIPTVAPYLLPKIMKPIREKFPHLKLRLHEHQTHILLEKLRRAELDLLILALPIDKHEFSQWDLFQEPFWLAVSREDELSLQDQVQLEDIHNKEILLLEEGHCLRDHALDVCYLAGAAESDSFHATSLETLRHMVGEGIGITLLPELAVSGPPTTKNSYIKDNICYIPFKQPVPSRRIGMLFRNGSYRQETYRQIAELIKRVFAP